MNFLQVSMVISLLTCSSFGLAMDRSTSKKRRQLVDNICAVRYGIELMKSHQSETMPKRESVLLRKNLQALRKQKHNYFTKLTDIDAHLRVAQTALYSFGKDLNQFCEEDCKNYAQADIGEQTAVKSKYFDLLAQIDDETLKQHDQYCREHYPELEEDLLALAHCSDVLQAIGKGLQ